MEAKKSSYYRMLEFIPGVLTWSLLIFPFVFSFISPVAVAIFFLIYIELWFFRSIKFAIMLIFGYMRTLRYKKIDYDNLLACFSDDGCEKKLSKKQLIHKDFYKRIDALKEKGEFKKAEDIIHVVVLATYKEDIEILRSSIGQICNADYPKEKLYFVLATEERDKERAEKYSKILKEEFGEKVGRFYSFMHPKDIEGEVIGKGGNITYSGKKITKILKEEDVDLSNVILTTLDADNRVSKTYFKNLTYHYLITENRKQKSFQPIPFFYNNIWQVPVFSRLVAISNTFWQMIQSVSKRNLRNFSSHAQSLDALEEMNFWSTKTIVEDGHQFWRAYFRYNGDHHVVPLFTPIYQDAVESKSYKATLVAQYKQLRRWAWGCSDIPFVINKIRGKKKGKIPFYRNLETLYSLIEGHVMWATAPIIITISSTFSKVIRDFSGTVVAYNLAHILSVLFSIAIAGIFVSLAVSLLMLPKPPKGIKYKFIAVFQWILIPFVTVLFGSIPAIDSHTRLLLGKYLEFNVTEKFRKT